MADKRRLQVVTKFDRRIVAIIGKEQPHHWGAKPLRAPAMTPMEVHILGARSRGWQGRVSMMMMPCLPTLCRALEVQ